MLLQVSERIVKYAMFGWRGMRREGRGLMNLVWKFFLSERENDLRGFERIRRGKIPLQTKVRSQFRVDPPEHLEYVVSIQKTPLKHICKYFGVFRPCFEVFQE